MGDEHEEIEFDEPIPEEDEEDEELFSTESLPPKVPVEPPVLNINLGSPAELSFTIP